MAMTNGSSTPTGPATPNEPAALPPGAELHALLPWHAAGLLDATDRARVDAALAGDPALRASLARVEEERAETIELNEALGAPSIRARDALFSRIEAEGRRPRRATGDWLDRVGAALAGLSPRVLAWSTAAAALAIVLQSGMLVATLVNERSPYETASGPGLSVPADGAFALVAFAPEATADEITRALLASRATVVGGPLPGGLYRLRVAERALSADEYGRALEALRSRGPAIRMVAPAN
jgi:anti-sigma factor RsiW